MGKWCNLMVGVHKYDENDDHVAASVENAITTGWSQPRDRKLFLVPKVPDPKFQDG